MSELSESQMSFSRRSFPFFIQCLLAKQEYLQFEGRYFSTSSFFNEDNCEKFFRLYGYFVEDKPFSLVKFQTRGIGLTTFFLVYAYWLFYSKQRASVVFVTNSGNYNLTYNSFGEICKAFEPFTGMSFVADTLKKTHMVKNREDIKFKVDFDTTYNLIGDGGYDLVVFDNAKIWNVNKLIGSLMNNRFKRTIMNFTLPTETDTETTVHDHDELLLYLNKFMTDTDLKIIDKID